MKDVLFLRKDSGEVDQLVQLELFLVRQGGTLGLRYEANDVTLQYREAKRPEIRKSYGE